MDQSNQPDYFDRPYGGLQLIAGNTKGNMASTLVDAKVLRIRAGCSTSHHFHLRSESIFYVLEGTVVLRSDWSGANANLAKGGAAIIRQGEDHTLTNTGPDDALVLEVEAPAYSRKDKFSVNPEAAPPSGEPLGLGRFWASGGQGPRLKICDVKTIDTAQSCYELGVDAIGIQAIGPKWRNCLAAADWLPLLPRDMSVFLLTDIHQPALLGALLKTLRCDTLQIQGEKSLDTVRAVASWARASGYKVVRTVPGPSSASIQETASYIRTVAPWVDAILLDKAWYGGTGEQPDWNAAKAMATALPPIPLVLAGGISANNITSLVRDLQPYGLDVESSVEWKLGAQGLRASVKSVCKIADLVRALRGSTDQRP